MKSFSTALSGLALVGSLLLGACSDSDSPSMVEPPPPPPPETTSFTGFVHDQFAATADDTDPVPVDDVDFDFDAEDDPDAFDDLL